MTDVKPFDREAVQRFQTWVKTRGRDCGDMLPWEVADEFLRFHDALVQMLKEHCHAEFGTNGGGKFKGDAGKASFATVALLSIVKEPAHE